MRRAVLVFVLLFLPLQASWAAVAAYCMHENGVATQHFGHHFHKHHLSAGDSPGDPSRGSAGVDKDCGFCHLNLKLVHATASIPQFDVGSHLNGFPPRHRYSSLVPQEPERPNWRALV